MVECVTLLAVGVFALDCPWYTIEANGEGTSGMNILSRWGGLVEIGVGD